MSGVEFAQTRKRFLQAASHPARRSGLFLDDLIMEDIGGRAQITGHGPVHRVTQRGFATRCGYFALYAARNIRVALSMTSAMRSSDGAGAAPGR